MNDAKIYIEPKIGIDSNFFVDLDEPLSPRHEKVTKMFDEWRMSENDLFIFYHVFLEYLHVITDPKRVKIPLTMKQALDRVDYWQSHSRIKVIYPDEKDFSLCECWLKTYNLGRNRLIDTLIAASYYNNGITEIWTSNPKDFEIFEEFEVKGTV